MKKQQALLLTAMALVLANAYAGSKTMYVHHNGDVDPIFYSEIDSICFSNIGLDSLTLAMPSVQEIWTPDSVYRYNIADIDSVSFQPIATIAKPEAINLADGLAPYIERFVADDDGTMLVLASSTPQALIPPEGATLYQIEPSDKLPNGFAATVYYANGNTLYCDDVDLGEIFTQLSWERSVEAALPSEGIVTQNYGVPETTPWLTANNDYPDLQSGVISMTDELRDIAAGPEQAKITSKIRIQPVVHYSIGAYVLPGTNTVKKRIHARVITNVEATAAGRCSTEDEHKIGSDKKYTQTRSLGLGQKFNLTFQGTMTLKGKMGIDYSYRASYRSTATSTLLPKGPTDISADLRTTHKVTSAPRHSLDASLDGKLSLSGTLTLTAVNLADSLKSVSNTFVYGTSLSGTALFLNSQLDEAGTDNALYQRITATGVKAQPIEAISTSIKYASFTLSSKARITPSQAQVFYAVPKYEYPVCEADNGTVSYTASGLCMQGRKSSMGMAVTNDGKNFDFVSTSAQWPATTIVSARPDFDIAEGDKIYPTATLCDKRILCAPAYPSVANNLYPVTSVAEDGPIRMTSGAQIIGTASNTGVLITIGNIFPPIKKK